MAGIGAAGNFPGPLFAATPPVEMEWSARRRIYQGVGAEAGDAYMQMAAERRTANDEDDYLHTLFGFVAGRLAERFGTSGAPIALSTACASGATAIQLGVEAIRRGDSTAALCVGTDCSVNAEAVMRLLHEACQRGLAVVVVTHDAQLASWADRVVFLRDGRVVDQTAPPAGPESLLAPGTAP